MSEVIECQKEREKYIDENASNNDEKVAMGVLENALAACEDDQDVQAARTAKAEAVADLAEFDESIPLDEQEEKKETEISKAEQEVENLIKQVIYILYVLVARVLCENVYIAAFTDRKIRYAFY